MSRTPIRLRTSEPGPDTVAGQLQLALSDLVELYLQTKQLHWTVVGPGFRALHESLDVLAAEALLRADEIAERMRAIDGIPNVRTSDLAASRRLEPAPVGEPTVAEAIAHLTGCLRRVVLTCEEVRDVVAPIDPPTVDLLHTVILGLDKHAWLLRAESGHYG